ncbi:MAG TPA: hypothetical protein P5137_08250 [Candidatus Brocadiia bacterium]|nr:hypothetical protein [Candidatus Brocadiia bacterium]
MAARRMKPNVGVQDDGQEALLRGKEALVAGDLDGAAVWFEAALSRNPRLAEARYYLAWRLETLRDLEGAIGAYEQLAQLEGQERWRTLAQLRTQALKRELGRQLLLQAALRAKGQQWGEAADTLRRAVALELPPALDQRARARYYRCEAERVASLVSRDGGPGESEMVDVAGLAPMGWARRWEARDFSELLRQTLSERPRLSVASRPMRWATVEAMTFSPPEQWPVWELGDGADQILVGTAGRKFALRLVGRQPPRVLADMAAPRAGAPPPFASNGPWAFLPDTDDADREMDVEVWTATESVRPSLGATWRIWATHDCFVKVFYVRPDGAVEPVYPAAGQAPGFVRGSQTVVVDAAVGRSDVAEREGVAGLWALASLADTDLDIGAASGAEAGRRIRDAVGRLREGSWVASSYRFRLARVE